MLKYHFFGYFLAAYTVVLSFIIGWFIVQARQEKRLLKSKSNLQEN
ncbi:MAG: hypothetical protein ACE5D2_04735 [Fidelibacterota bacterium]